MLNLLDRALGKYVILEEIGRGGMATVYKARDVELDRIVAMKVLSPYLVGEPRLVQRFMGEARLAANLNHPNIVTIYDIGGEGGYYYFVMKYLEGRPLKEILAQRGPLPLDEVLAIARQLASALDYAHEQNLVHRDIKPGNIIVGADGQAVLTDFGLAKVAENLKLTASGEAIGTLEYMAPEQARGDAEKSSDIYSLGVIIYEMLTGRLPFQGDSQATLLYQHLHEPPPPLRQWNPAIPVELEQVVLKAMAKEPAQRYATAGEMVRELEQAARKAVFPLLGRRPARARVAEKPARAAAGPATPEAAPARRLALPPFAQRWWGAALAFIVVMAVGIGLGVHFLGGRPAIQPAVPTGWPTRPEPTTSVVASPVPPTSVPLVATSSPLPRQPTGVELALLCELSSDAAAGSLAFWQSGQEEPGLWPGMSGTLVVSQMSWSPDGSSVVFVQSEEGRPNLFRVRFDGTDLFRLTDTPEGKEDPAWSPDGKQVAFADGPQGRRGIFLVPAIGGKPFNLTPGKSDDWAPSWSPDGRTLAFVSNRDGNSEIYLLELSSNEVQRLTDHPGNDVYPVWAPDGEHILFLSDRSGGFHLYQMDREGQHLRLVFDRALWLERVTWSPDGKWLAITRQTAQVVPQVFFLEISTGELVPGPAGCRRPTWRPQ